MLLKPEWKQSLYQMVVSVHYMAHTEIQLKRLLQIKGSCVGCCAVQLLENYIEYWNVILM